MKIFLTLIPVIAATFLSASAFSANRKVLLVSDIDDTIKNSHVLSATGKIAQAANISAAFTGMSQLYTLLNAQKDIKIVYLSNAPEQVVGLTPLKYLHQTFLDYNKFPKGDLLLRPSLYDQNHKIVQLRRLMQVEQPTDVIMIGDNGERDPQIYHQVFSEYRNLNVKMLTFIHQVYSSKNRTAIDHILGSNLFSEVGSSIFPEQFGYVTPVEIALQLYDEGLLTSENKNWMVDKMASYIAIQARAKHDVNGETTFASYQDCSDFQWRWPVFREITPLLEKIKTECK